MTDNSVRYHCDSQGVAHIILNRPSVHNAFDDHMIATLIELLNKINHSPDERVIVIGSEGKNFSAGADLNWMQRMTHYSEEENLQDSLKLAQLMQTLNSLDKPTIALIQGATLGGGIGLIACCDIAIAADNATFCFSEVKLGLIPSVISPYIINAIGQRAARRFFLTAESFTAVEAKTIGLIHEIVPEAELKSVADKIISKLLQNSHSAVRAAKKLISEVGNKAITSELIYDTAERIAKIRVSEDAQTRLKKFLAKQPL